MITPMGRWALVLVVACGFREERDNLENLVCDWEMKTENGCWHPQQQQQQQQQQHSLTGRGVRACETNRLAVAAWRSAWRDGWRFGG